MKDLKIDLRQRQHVFLVSLLTNLYHVQFIDILANDITFSHVFQDGLRFPNRKYYYTLHGYTG